LWYAESLRRDTMDAGRYLLSRERFQRGIDPPDQRDDPILDRDSDFVGPHTWIPL